jgi:hypothetical protein
VLDFSELAKSVQNLTVRLYMFVNGSINPVYIRRRALLYMLAFSMDFFLTAVKAIKNSPDDDFTTESYARLMAWQGDLVLQSSKEGIGFIWPTDQFTVIDWKEPDLERVFHLSSFDDFVNKELFSGDDDDFFDALPIT